MGGPAQVWAEATAAYDRSVTSGTRARLDSTVGLLRNFAVTGGDGLLAARRHRVAAITAAEELGDPEVTARVIGAYDVPAIWTRVDDPEQAAGVVAAAERTLAAFLPGAHPAARARLLATIALESRGTHSPRGHEAAREAEEIARSLDDPTLLAFALNAVFMQSFQRAGLAPLRDSIGAEQVALSARNGLATWEVLGHLIRLQARGALGDSPGADRHAADADQLAERHELPLVGVFTRWYRALRLAATGGRPAAEAAAAYQEAAALLEGCGMPGLERGLLPLALLCVRVRHAQPAQADEDTDWGPYEPWVRPLVLLARDRGDWVAAALQRLPAPARPAVRGPVVPGRTSGRRRRRPCHDGARPHRTHPRGGGVGRCGQRSAHPGPGRPAPRRPGHGHGPRAPSMNRIVQALTRRRARQSEPRILPLSSRSPSESGWHTPRR